MEPKYIIERADGQPIDPARRFVVLDLTDDHHAITAAAAYAQSITFDNPRVAEELWRLIRNKGCVGR